MKKLCGLLALLSLQAFALEVTPTTRLNQSLEFVDDMNFANLDVAISRQLSAYDSMNLNGTIKFGSRIYQKTVLRESLLILRDLVKETQDCFKTRPEKNCLDAFNEQMNQKFTIYTPIPNKGNPGSGLNQNTKFTSYYSPDLTGSRVKTEKYNHAIYRVPESPRDQNFTRVEIDFKGALEGKGYDIFYVEDSYYDLYLLHVQGGGRIKVFNADGTFDYRYLSYAGKNNRSFKMIYHYMVDQGYLEAGQAGVVQQRKWLQDHPDQQEEVFSSCPSYVYFKESTEEPIGLNSIPLTEGRSLAVDNSIYKTTGIINFIKTNKPVKVNDDGSVSKVPFSRFYISQDTGGAIKGNARCDLYAGYGKDAELQAYNTDDMGEQYFLIRN